MKVYVTRPVFDEAIDRLRREFEVELNTEDRILPKQELIAHLGDKDGALTLLTDAIDLELLQSTPRLKVVANFAVGFNLVCRLLLEKKKNRRVQPQTQHRTVIVSVTAGRELIGLLPSHSVAG